MVVALNLPGEQVPMETHGAACFRSSQGNRVEYGPTEGKSLWIRVAQALADSSIVRNGQIFQLIQKVDCNSGHLFDGHRTMQSITCGGGKGVVAPRS